MNVQELFNPRPPHRTAEQWKEILRRAVRELEESLGVPARIIDFTVQDDKPGFASSDNGVDVEFETQSQLGYDLCGVISCLVREHVSLDGEFLAFTKGIRVPQYRDQRLVYVFDPSSTWSCSGWQMDDTGEWATTKDDSRWRRK